MGLVLYANSWVTLNEANIYLSDKVNSTIWTTDPSSNYKYLIEAFWSLYYSKEYNIPKTSTAENVKNAQCEFAFWLKENYTDYKKRQSLQNQGVKEFTIDDFTEIYDRQEAIIPEIVGGMLDDFESNAAGFAKIKRKINY